MGLALAAGWILAGAGALGMETGRFPAPPLEGYRLERTRWLDKDAIPDGEKETELRIYVDARGRYLVRYATGGIVWAWGVIGNLAGGREDTAHNYALVDSDGDGTFDRRYEGDEEFFLPRWVRRVRPA